MRPFFYVCHEKPMTSGDSSGAQASTGFHRGLDNMVHFCYNSIVKEEYMKREKLYCKIGKTILLITVVYVTTVIFISLGI